MFKRLLVLLIVTIGGFRASGQEISSFNHTFNNLYLINPASAGALGHPVGYLTYHKTWVGIEGAPESTSLSFNTPTGGSVGLGFNIYNDKRSVLGSTGTLLTFGYGIHFSDVSHLRFGISGGASFNSFDLANVQVSDPDDLALVNKLNNSFSPEGNFGIQLDLNNFHGGVALPKLFSTPVISPTKVAKAEFQQFDNLLFNAGYRFKVVPKIIEFHPMILYRMYKGNAPQVEANAVFTFNQSLWVGGNYKQDYGFAALAGVKIKRLSIGYSYEIPSNEIRGYVSASHEIQLAIHLGKKKQENKKPPVPTKKPAVIKPPVNKPANTQKTNPTTTQKPATATVIAKAKPDEPIKKEPVKTDTTKKKQSVVVVNKKPDVTSEYKPQEVRKSQVVVVTKKPEPQKTEPVVSKPVEKKQEPVTQKTEPQKTVTPTKTENTQPVYIAKSTVTAPAIKITKDTVAKTVTYETETKMITVPAGEKIVVARRGTHPLELGPGNYIIVGAFAVFENANKFKVRLTNQGYPAKLGYNSDKNLYYVYVHSEEDLIEAIEYKNELRKQEDFENAWVFIVD